MTSSRLLIECASISFYSTVERGWKVFWKGWVLFPVFMSKEEANQYIADLDQGKVKPTFCAQSTFGSTVAATKLTSNAN